MYVRICISIYISLSSSSSAAAVAASSHAAGMDFLDSLSLANHPYHPLLPVDLLIYILCPYRADVGMFFLIVQHWKGHVKGSIEERHL